MTDRGRTGNNGSVRSGPRRSQAQSRSRGGRFERLYRAHFGLLWSAVRSMGVATSQQEDVLQEVWLRVYRRLNTLDPDASVKAWLCSIARNVVLHHHRSGYRRQRKLATLAAEPVSRSPDPQGRHVARDSVAKILATMDEEQRNVLVLAQVHGLSGPEIAVGLGIPLNTAYSRLRLARQHVRAVAAVEAELERREQPPAGQARKTWALLLPHVGGATPLVASAGVWATAKFWIPAAGLAVAGMGAVAVAMPEAPSSLNRSATAAGVHAPPDLAAPSTDGPASDFAGSSVAPVGDPDPELAVQRVVAPETPRAGLTKPGSSNARRSTRAPSETDTSVALPSSPIQQPSAQPAGESEETSAPALVAEAQLLRSAQAALGRGNAKLALEYLDRHAREFPKGQLAEAREGAAVRALCRAGRTTQARARAKSLRSRRPGSAVAEAVRDVCVAEKIQPPVTDHPRAGNEGDR